SFLRDIDGAKRHGQNVPLERITTPRELAPQLSENIRVAYRLEGQRFIEPGPFVRALAQAVESRGAAIRTGAEAISIQSTMHEPQVKLACSEILSADSIVLATGAWLPDLARQLGVRTRLQA